MPAVLASVRRTISLPVVLGYTLAGRAVDAVRVKLADQIFEASRIVGKLPLELKQRITRLRGGGSFWVISVNLGHTLNIPDGSTAVKGIIAQVCLFEQWTTEKRLATGVRYRGNSCRNWLLPSRIN